MKSGNILGIGNDIVEIERIRKSIDAHGQRLLDRLFTPKEQEYCFKHKDSALHFAGRFSAKEAVVKALGTGFGKDASWKDIEILNEPSGKPVVHPSPALAEKLAGTQLLVSISHSHFHVTAFAIWQQLEVQGI